METFNLDLIPKGSKPVCHVSQYDTGRTIRINLFEGALPYTLSGAETVSVSVRKPDGHIVTEGLTNTSSTYVEIVTTEQMTACEGDNLCEVKIESGSDVLGTLNFIMSVELDPLANGDPSESFIYNLEIQIYNAVADQYDSNNVIFDNAPTAGHNQPYTVTSAGIKTELDTKANTADLATVATTGDYDDLTNKPTIPENLDDLNDVNATTPNDGDALTWDANASEWVPQAGATSLSGLSDTDIQSATSGQVLAYDGSKWANSSALHIATFSFSKSINATTEATFFITRSDFNLPTNAKVKDGYIKQSSAVNTSNTWAYACITNESATNAMQGAIYNPTNSNRSYTIMATVFYYL